MNVIIDWILRNIRTGRAAWNESTALIVNAVTKNNPEARDTASAGDLKVARMRAEIDAAGACSRLTRGHSAPNLP